MDRIVSLQQGIDEFKKADFFFLFKTLLKIGTSQHLGNGRTSRQGKDFLRGQLVQPDAIENNFGPFRVKDLENLLFVGFGVLIDFLPGQLGPYLVLARRVPYLGGEITDQKKDRVPEILQLT